MWLAKSEPTFCAGVEFRVDRSRARGVHANARLGERIHCLADFDLCVADVHAGAGRLVNQNRRLRNTVFVADKMVMNQDRLFAALFVRSVAVGTGSSLG